MPLVATIIASSQDPVIDDGLSNQIALALNSRPLWLDAGAVCDFTISAALGESEVTAALEACLRGRQIDFAVQDSQLRRKSGLIADMDSTMIRQECIDELAEEAGHRQEVAAITERAMKGELEFESALRQRVKLLAGLSVEIIDQVIGNRIETTQGARTAVATIRAHGGYAVLVSGGFSQFTGPIAQTLGFDEQQANLLEIRLGKLTGRIVEPILGREAKREALLRVCAARSMEPEDFMAVGDGANDLDMLETAGTGVAFRAKPIVAERAKVQVNHADLTALLFLQGYRRADFVE